LLSNVTKLPAVPFKLKVPTVVVSPDARRTNTGCTEFASVVNVFDPVVRTDELRPFMLSCANVLFCPIVRLTLAAFMLRML
jgi:hypothetical protein